MCVSRERGCGMSGHGALEELSDVLMHLLATRTTLQQCNVNS